MAKVSVFVRCLLTLVVLLSCVSGRRITSTTTATTPHIKPTAPMNTSAGHQGGSGSRRVIPDEQRLLNKVFRAYDNSVRPVYNATSNVVVRFGLTLIQIMDMVSCSFYIPFYIHPITLNVCNNYECIDFSLYRM